MVVPSVDIANKIADVFGVSLDYLVGNSELILDKELVSKIAQIQQLPNEQLNIVNALLDAFLRDFKTKKNYSV
ncbi:XRE family transcriptional regulator [Apibacter sp. HY039]|uniref:XRE family transcriptional regulator n=1 Tax=Apibacter sp. HY039 TaxID=2501476 RepID=UPI000FEC08AB|nr:XRE family transcriptional regulator [Apibacter sp. HY039]